MQILGKRSKILLIAVAIAMLAALGLSFALWDTQAVKASSGDLSQYANAKVGDVITFGDYYQTTTKDSTTGKYPKTPMEWIVVDKDERSGQMTVLSKYIIATGSYFGNWYHDKTTNTWKHYDNSLTANIAYNQAYVDSTARAFLNNLERLDLGSDYFDKTEGYMPSYTNSTLETGLLSSIGFSNQRYWTDVKEADAAKSKPGFVKRTDGVDEYYYQRPTDNSEYKNRPATLGFYDEAFSDEEKSIIVPKQIAGYTGHRWPDDKHDMATKSYVEGAYDKVWLPSATELNIMNGKDWQNQGEDAWTNPSDEAGSSVFEYFKNYSQYKNPVTNTQNNSVSDAVKTTRTALAEKPSLGNYSIPVYARTSESNTTLTVFDSFSDSNTSDYYWTRSPGSSWYTNVRTVGSLGIFYATNTRNSNIGVRPCVILKY